MSPSTTDKAIWTVRRQTKKFSQAAFREAASIFDGTPAHFAFIMDEMRHQEWGDRNAQICFVPVFHLDGHVTVPIPEVRKRITLVACISGDGSFLKWMIIIHRKTDDDGLVLMGFTSEKLTVRSQSKGYMDTESLDAWLAETFLTELSRRRKCYHHGAPAILPLDNCVLHAKPAFLALCQQNHVIGCFFLPQKSNQLQALDLSLFVIAKRVIARARWVEPKNIQTKHIAQIVEPFISAAIPWNIIQSFRLSWI